ncbi:putative DC1.2-like [Tripterygium wilfordii]|uniref:Putative DC1.2-like n=1 Tax=Tripterygium wilfordii TaxID=458696 RepID=A0A7J7CAG2_TRIWF|nr:21 kDa protein-like [Tripterygium wilfordii]KAF5731080.1 putative DC1.2-like [Tripterygium wilfordii]
MAGILKFLLILLAINFYTSVGRELNEKSSSTSAYQEFIKTSCGATTYRSLCISSLSSQASSIQTSPKLLAHAALNVTLSAAKSTSTMMYKLSQSHGMKPREVQAMRDCIEELSDTIDELRKSIREMGEINSSNYELTISDIQTWVSAALTDESTCSDGFAGNSMNGNVKTAVRGQIVNISHLTSNALALFNSYASLHD